jgi:hypothetical protein
MVPSDEARKFSEIDLGIAEGELSIAELALGAQ